MTETYHVVSNISFSEAALSYASIQSAIASNRQHALSRKCHNCKSRQHICNDSAFSVMGLAEQAMMLDMTQNIH